MINFGDITKIDGSKVPSVDCVIGGSPCQDLSIAGKREGLDGVRSGLFMEQIRVIKEMREFDKKNGRTGKDIRPRYMVWENVPGAFSSNRGEDFRIVLEETARIADKDATIPEPEKDKNGRLKWSTVGSILGDGWSIAWRVLDAQFWGVPQRRRRISLVADFGGESAGEILFERKSVSRNYQKSGKTWEEATIGFGNDIRKSVNRDVRSNLQDGIEYNALCYDMTHACDVIRECGEIVPTLQNRMGTGGNQIPLIRRFHVYTNKTTDKSAVANVCDSDNEFIRRLTPLECERLQGYPDNWTVIGTPEIKVVKDRSPDTNKIIGQHEEIVYCYKDESGKSKKVSDTARYKAIGNSIAIPPWMYVLKNISSQYDGTPTMASLFDGIGGFPYIWQRINGEGTCKWISEIEEFPLAVTRERFE